MNLIAKPIVENQLWVITDGSKKIGNVEAQASGYTVKIGNNTRHFVSTSSIEDIVKIQFQSPESTDTVCITPYAVWPTNGKPYNSVYNVKHRCHLYTTSEDSKCYHAAGWFKIKLNDVWQTIFCPKFIYVQRYPYSGPFMTENEADNK